MLECILHTHKMEMEVIALKWHNILKDYYYYKKRRGGG